MSAPAPHPSESLPERCVLCTEGAFTVEHQADRLTVLCCTTCGHRLAAHAALETPSDYYENTPQAAAFLATLEDTRRRQARRILARLVELGGAPADWFDFGFGRGWFLDEARPQITGAAGGFDGSALAQRWAQERGLSVARALPGESPWPDWTSLPYVPQVVSLLDVVEHMEGMSAQRALERIRDDLPRLSWLIVKVPSSEGVLYRTASALRRLARSPYEQLYQVGTLPPHYHYFNPRSLAELLARSGYELRSLLFDRDVDDLFHRIGPLARLPGGRLAARAVGLFPADTVVAFATVRGRPPG